jgi:ubiquinone/menaquinone biosynthesis C-methylase UbiE
VYVPKLTYADASEMRTPVMAWLDRVLYRHPFEGASARRYASSERPAFGDLDDRLIDDLALDRAAWLLDVGCGPGSFATAAARRHPALAVIALDPSAAFARRNAGVGAGIAVVRAAAEAIPLAGESIDVAVCVSSLRHVRDRALALRELRRVVRQGGRLVVVELDPQADRRRIAVHADRLATPLLRHAFGPLVVRTAPTAAAIEALARAAGWTCHTRRDDREQPVYILDLR